MNRDTQRTAAAERMRRHRQRPKDGLRCLSIEVRETEVDALVRRGFSQQELKEDSDAIMEGLYAYLDQTLGRVR